jgi:hypothetical protein
MPLIAIPGADAFRTRKQNPFATWGSRAEANRVEPIAKPAFTPGFSIEAGERIFTIGSCFARHVEEELIARGFQLPARQLLEAGTVADATLDVLNLFGTPSILNELTWALDPAQPFTPEDHFLEVRPGRYVDPHLPIHVSPAPWEKAVSRRAAIAQLMATAADCRVVIITLGLSELWFDAATGHYLNHIPRPSVLRQFPDRFELHVLSFEETRSFLERALLLLRATGRSDKRMLLTVSPVPLTATHRPTDVMVANAYSKSVLRCAAEEMTLKYEWADYYPSYESVTLSDRRVAWDADLIHVSRELIAVNVRRMIDGYVGFAAVAASEDARGVPPGEAERDAPLVAALERARHLLSAQEYDAAVAAVSELPADFESLAVAMVRAEAHRRGGHANEAVAALAAVAVLGASSQAYWELLVSAHAAAHDVDGAVVAAHRYLSAMGYAKCWVFLHLARCLREVDADRAAHYYESTIDDFCDADGWLQWEVADFLIQRRRFDAARRMLTHIGHDNADLRERVAAAHQLLATVTPLPDLPA